MTARLAVKRTVQAFALLIAAPPAAVALFGRFGAAYAFFAHFYALIPGLPGAFLRAAYYKMTLNDASLDTSIAFGSYFSQTDVSLGPNVSVGSFCVIGNARIGARTQISSHVQIPGGRHGHVRQHDGKLSDLMPGTAPSIGEDCWIGASAVILADIGNRSTIGAGAVVVKPVPADAVAVGNPARLIRTAGTSEAGA